MFFFICAKIPRLRERPKIAFQLMKINNPGQLFIVATPIGHLDDITLRAISTLKTVDWIAAEDTRHCKRLLSHYSISTKLISLHDFNERERAHQLLERLREGESIALVSDAGTPLISDPGFHLVRAVREAGIKVVPIPGACAAIAALSVSGLPTDRFFFEGFLSHKNQARLTRLTELQPIAATLIFYESPHRILDTLKAMESVLGGERQAVIARELTKVFETIHDARLSEMVKWVSEDADQQRGEMVILIEGCKPKVSSSSEETEKLVRILVNELPLKQAVELAAKISGERKNDLYSLALQIKDQT